MRDEVGWDDGGCERGQAGGGGVVLLLVRSCRRRDGVIDGWEVVEREGVCEKIVAASDEEEGGRTPVCGTIGLS